MFRLRRLVVLFVVGLSLAACARPTGQIVVPNLVGTHRDEAQAVLSRAGLRYQVVVQPLRVQLCPSFAGLVVAQSPRGGTPALSWTVVTIVAYSNVAHPTIGTACGPPP